MRTAIKITLILTKSGKKVFRYPSYLKAINFAYNKANLLLKTHKIHLHVDYPNGFTNDMDIHSKDDLIWALTAFVKEYSKDFV